METQECKRCGRTVHPPGVKMWGDMWCKCPLPETESVAPPAVSCIEWMGVGAEEHD